MNKLIDITHTVKASAAPSEGARYMFDPATGERHWVEPEPVMEEPNPVIFDSIVEGAVEEYLMGKEPDSEVSPVPMPTLPKRKKPHHG